MRYSELLNTVPVNDVVIGNAYKYLQALPPELVHAIVTSPPYWGLRDYGIEPTRWPSVTYTLFGKKIRVKAMKCCLGLEDSHYDFVGHIVLIFREAFRVLRSDGTLWLNMGDSYAHNGAAYGSAKSTLVGRKQGSEMGQAKRFVKKSDGLKPKDLVGIPWMIAFALREDGWYLRMDNIWSKPNPMPESVKDRTTKAHEYVFQLTKSPSYYYDSESIKTSKKKTSIDREQRAVSDSHKNVDGAPGQPAHSMNKPRDNKVVKQRGHARQHNGLTEVWDHMSTTEQMSMGANKRSVWEVATKPFAGAHFATYPPELILDCIKASTSEHGCCSCCGIPYERAVEKELRPTDKASFNSKVDSRDTGADKQDQGSNRQKDGHKPGWAYASKTTGWTKKCDCEEAGVTPAIVMDMFFGSGTTGEVAAKLNRYYMGSEISYAYKEISDKRLYKSLGLFAPAIATTAQSLPFSSDTK